MIALLILVAWCSPIFAVGLILLLCSDNSRPAIYAIGMAMAAAISFYHLHTGIDTDVVRHMEYLAYYKGLPFFGCFDAGHYRQLYVWDIWNWIISNIGNPYLLQSSAAFVNYGLLSFIVFDSGKRFDLKHGQVVTLWLLAISLVSPTALVVGIRNGTACMVAAFAVYRHYVMGKGQIGSIILLLISLLIHHSALMLCILYPFVKVFQKSPKVGAATVFIGFICVGAVSEVAVQYFPANGNPISSLLNSVFSSITDTMQGDEWSREHASSFNTMINNIWEYLIIGCMALEIIFCFNKKTSVTAVLSIHPTISFTAMVLIASFALMLIFPVNGGRLVTCAISLAICCFASLLGERKKKDLQRYLLIDYITSLVAVGAFLLHAYSLMYGGTDAISLVAGFCFGGFAGIA